MPTLWVVFNEKRITEAEDTALPALLSLCGALGVHARWDEAEGTLFIAPPAADPPAPEPPSEESAPIQPVLNAAFPSPEEAGIPIEYVQTLIQAGEEPPRLVLFPDWSASQALETDPEPEEPAPPEALPAVRPAAEAAPALPEPLPIAAEGPGPATAEEHRVVLTRQSSNPVPFRFLPYSDPRRVPGADKVLVFSREPAPPAPQPPETPQPISALEEFFRLPSPEPKPPPPPAQVKEELVAVKAVEPHPKRRSASRVRIIQ